MVAKKDNEALGQISNFGNKKCKASHRVRERVKTRNRNDEGSVQSVFRFIGNQSITKYSNVYEFKDAMKKGYKM